MDKNTRYLVAIIVCVGLFALWIVFQAFVAKGTLVAVLFCGAIVGAWKAITGIGDKTEIGQDDTTSPTDNNKTDSSSNIE